MNRLHSHQNARLGFAGRACLVERVLRDGWTAPEAAAAFHVSVRTVGKWVRRFQEGGRATCGPRGPTGWEHLPVAVDDAARVASAGPHTAHGRLPPIGPPPRVNSLSGSDS